MIAAITFSCHIAPAHRLPPPTSAMTRSRSRPLKARRLSEDIIELSSGESDSEAVSYSGSEYGTAYESTNYDGSDKEEFVRRMFQTLTVETAPNVYGAYHSLIATFLFN